MKLLALVAHPDDCVIFAMPFISQTTWHNWTIVYLTYQPGHPRTQEISKFWDARNVKTEFLGLRDVGIVLKKWNANSIATQFVDRGFDLVLTHNATGEYGHPHHEFVHSIAELVPLPKIYFEPSGQSNLACDNLISYNLSEIPLHAEAVEMFEDRDVGRYQIPKDTLGDSKWKKLQFMMWAEKLSKTMKRTFSKITSTLRI